jgi:phosphopantetheinyl transferase
MVYLAYSKPNKCTRNEMSAEGERLLRVLLEQAGENTDVELAREPSGRPYIIGRKDLDFNVSHSDGIVVCALSVGDGRVGVDCEPVISTVPVERQKRFSEKYFSEKEKILLESDPTCFSKIWTAKEAYLKRSGRGISTDLSKIDTAVLIQAVSLVTVEREKHFITVCTSEGAQIKII